MYDIRGCNGNKTAGPISREHPLVTSCSGLPMHGSMRRPPLFIMHTNSNPSAVQAMSVIHHALCSNNQQYSITYVNKHANVYITTNILIERSLLVVVPTHLANYMLKLNQ